MVPASIPLPARRSWRLRLMIFSLLAAMLFGTAAAAPWLLRHFARVFPDNYIRRAEEALKRGDSDLAARIARQRIDRVGWDMDAHYLLTRAQAASGKPEEAAATMLEAMRKAFTARGRQITVTGYDEALVFRLLGDYLWEAGRYQYAGDMYRAAIDGGAADVGRQLLDRGSAGWTPEAAAAAALVFLKLHAREPFERALQALESAAAAERDRALTLVLRAQWIEQNDRDPERAMELLVRGEGSAQSSPAVLSEPLVRLHLAGLLRRTRHAREGAELEEELRSEPGLRVIGFENFELPTGGVATSTVLQLSRRGTASAHVETGAFRVTNLLVQASAAPAFGQWPILVVSAGERELTRLYLDGLQPQALDLSLFPEGAPKLLKLELTFTNDAYDPVTRADRDIKIHLLAFH